MDDKFSEYLLNIKRQLGPLDNFSKIKTMIFVNICLILVSVYVYELLLKQTLEGQTRKIFYYLKFGGLHIPVVLVVLHTVWQTAK